MALTARFAVITSFGLSNAANAFLWISFSPIYANVGSFWGVNSAAVNWLSLLFLLLYLPGALLASVVTERYGLRIAVITGAGGNAIGAWLRYAGAAMPNPHGFAIALTGQFLAALAQPVFTNSPARISAEWFPRSERDLATLGASLSNAVGNALGSALPPIAVNVASDLPSFLLYQAIACSILFVIQIMGMRSDAPIEAPSAAAAARRAARIASSDRSLELLGSENTDSIDAPQNSMTLSGAARTVFRDYTALLSNGNFRSLTIGFGLGLGLFNALLTLMGQVLANCGYGDDVAGNAGAALLGAGLVSAGIAGVILEKTRAYVMTLRVLIVTGLFAVCFFLATQRPNSPDVVLAASALLLFHCSPSR